MSFGIGIGDSMGAAQLGYNLWKYCYKVARDAPLEFQQLVIDINTLWQSLRFLDDETKDIDARWGGPHADDERAAGARWASCRKSRRSMSSWETCRAEG